MNAEAAQMSQFGAQGRRLEPRWAPSTWLVCRGQFAY
jgi:hypothetical protein